MSIDSTGIILAICVFHDIYSFLYAWLQRAGGARGWRLLFVTEKRTLDCDAVLGSAWARPPRTRAVRHNAARNTLTRDGPGYVRRPWIALALWTVVGPIGGCLMLGDGGALGARFVLRTFFFYRGLGALKKSFWGPEMVHSCWGLWDFARWPSSEYPNTQRLNGHLRMRQ